MPKFWASTFWRGCLALARFLVFSVPTGAVFKVSAGSNSRVRVALTGAAAPWAIPRSTHPRMRSCRGLSATERMRIVQEGAKLFENPRLGLLSTRMHRCPAQGGDGRHGDRQGCKRGPSTTRSTPQG
jgi:hypothetical protein